MALDLYKHAVRLIKVAETLPTFQQDAYSVGYTSGVAFYPRYDVDVRNWNTNSYAEQVSKEMQEKQNSGEMDYRSKNPNAAWKNRMAPINELSLSPVNRPTVEQQKNFDRYGIDFDDFRIQQLGNDAEIYEFDEGAGSNYQPGIDRINYSHYWGVPHTTADAQATMAHETAHRVARHTRDTRYDTKRHTSGDDHDYGYYGIELPAIINEWTYGQAQGTIHPNQLQTYWGGRRPERRLTNSNRTTDSYYANLFPLVNMADLKSEPGRVYRYWHGPGEPNIPTNTPKRLVYETPNGYWVDPEGNWVPTGADVFDPVHLPLDNNINVAFLTPNMQNFVHNMRILSLAQPTESRMEAIRQAKETLQDLLSVLALRRGYRGSEGRTLADMIKNTVGFIEGMNTTRNTELYDNKIRFGEDKKLEDSINRYYDLLIDNGLLEHAHNNKEAIRYKTIPYAKNYHDTLKIIEQKPWWSPDSVKYPMIPELAEMQKKYAISPTLDEPTDVRDLIQLQAMIDEAIQIYQRRRAWEKEEGLKGDPNWQEDPKDPRWLLLDSLTNTQE